MDDGLQEVCEPSGIKWKTVFAYMHFLQKVKNILGPSEKLTTHRSDRYLSKLRHIFKFTELQLYEESFTFLNSGFLYKD